MVYAMASGLLVFSGYEHFVKIVQKSRVEKFSIQTFHYTSCFTAKRVTNLRGPSTRHCARATQLRILKCCNSGEP